MELRQDVNQRTNRRATTDYDNNKGGLEAHRTIHTPDPLILKGYLSVRNVQSPIVILWLTSTKVL
jgi:hypothetical protein